MEKEEKGVTLGRVFKVAFSNWKLLVPVTAVVAVACVLGIHFGLNSYRGSYSSTFSYSSADLSKEKYADGSSFFYRNLISSTNLENIKNSDEKYSSIDVQRILDSNAITISKASEENVYTISLGYKYIKNQDIAKSFINDIASSALKKDAEIVANGSFDSSLVLFDNADTFEQQVNYLNRQSNFLVDSYKTIKENPAISTLVVNKAVANSEKVTLILGTNFVERTKLQISSNGYVKDYNSQEAKNYESTKNQLNQEKTLNEAKIAALEVEIGNISTEAAISSFSKEVETLVFRNVDIQYEIDSIDNKLANKGKTPEEIPGYKDFVSNLVNYRAELSNAVSDYKDVLKSAYIDDAEVSFENSSIIRLNGTINIYVNIVLSLVAGVVVGAVVSLIVDCKKLYE